MLSRRLLPKSYKTNHVNPSCQISRLEFCLPIGLVRKFHSQHIPLMVFGSTTDVGKTVVCAGLCRAAITKGRKTCYIKPIQTGEPDEYFVQLYANPKGDKDLVCRTIHHWVPAMSSHIVANLAGHKEDDDDLVKRLSNEMKVFRKSAGSKDTLTIVETAGGVLSPGPSRNLQADTYRRLRMSVVLVGDAKLGGITSTLCAIEALRLRGYSIHAVVMIETDDSSKHGNAKFIQSHLNKSFSGIPADNPFLPQWSEYLIPQVFSLSALPSSRPLLHDWYADNMNIFNSVIDQIQHSIALSRAHKANVLEAGPDVVWFPFTLYKPKPAASSDPITVDSQPEHEDNYNYIDSAYGDHFRVIKPMIRNPTVESSGEAKKSQQRIPTETALSYWEEYFDGSASWWTQGVGHGNSRMSLAIAEAAGRWGHVLMPGNLHAPVVQLSRYLVQRGPGKGWAARCFYSDNGSTAMEVAVKVGLRLSARRRLQRILSGTDQGAAKALSEEEEMDLLAEREAGKEVVVLGQVGSYHGDTLGVMDLSPKNVMNARQHPWYRPRVIPLHLPYISYRKGVPRIDASDLPEEVRTAVAAAAAKSASAPQPTSWVGEMESHWSSSSSVESNAGFGSMSDLLDTAARLPSELAEVYRTHIRQFLDSLDQNHIIGAFVFEPVMLGAGGFKFVDPLFQTVVVQECKSRGIAVIADEVATGMWRLGPVSACSGFLKIEPDVASFAKLLTGGYLPLGVTLATEEAFDSFRGKAKASALLHGHSYAGNPICCAAALEAISIFESSPNFNSANVSMGGGFTESDAQLLSKAPGVQSVMAMGFVLAVELASEVGGYESDAASIVIALLREEKVLARPLGNVIYLMASPVSLEFDVRRLMRVMERCLTRAHYERGVDPKDLQMLKDHSN